MNLLAQHGYAKSAKIDTALDRCHIQGVILGPRDESPEAMHSYAEGVRARFPKAEILFDPQFYASTVLPAREGHLPEYKAYYSGGLTRKNFLSTKHLEDYVSKTLDYQLHMPVSKVLSPTVTFDDFNDPWSQVALSLAQASVEYHTGLKNPPLLLLSFVIGESAFRHFDAMAEFLDLVSSLEPHGFYLVIKRSTPQYSQQMDERVLENILYMTYVLSTINDFHVVFGYTDIVGLFLQAVGADATACGWHNSLRQFSLARFMPAAGGRTPRPRYTSMPLLNNILLIPELSTAYHYGLLDSVLSGSQYDASFASGFETAEWTAERGVYHHWAALSGAFSQLSRKLTVKLRLAHMEQMITTAQGLYSSLRNSGIVFETSSGSNHLDQWASATREFRAKVRV